MITTTAREILAPLRGKGNFFNCVDFDDAIKAMETYKGIWQDQAITLHKILYKILNEGKPAYTAKELDVIKSIINEHLNEK